MGIQNQVEQHIQQKKNEEVIKQIKANTFFEAQFQDKLKQIKKKIILSTLIKIQEQQLLSPQKKNIQEQQISHEKIQECQQQLQHFLEEQKHYKNEAVWNQLSLYYFIATYFFDQKLYEKNYECYGPADDKLKNEIQNIMQTLTIEKQNSLINTNIEDIQKILKDEKQIDYEESFDEQPFTIYFQSLTKHKYSDYFKKFQLERIELGQQYKDEQDFLNDLIECYEIWGNMSLIDQYRNNRTLLYWQFLDSFFAKESQTNLIRKYKISDFKFFDKFDLLQIIFESEYISTLTQENEDEIYFYFLLVCLFNLLKLNYLAANKEQQLVKLIEKIKSFDSIKFKLGYKFLLKFMMDLQEKKTLSESSDDYVSKELEENLYQDELDQKSLVWLFKEWTQQKYQVSEQYINKQQLQLCIDAAQSALILSILPDLARFYDIKEPLPYQPTNIDIGYVQQIIRGKRLYLKKPQEKEKNLNYWEKLIESIEITKGDEYKIKKGQRKENQKNIDPDAKNVGNQIICLTICKINKLTLQLLYESENQRQEVTEDLRYQIQGFIQQIDCTLYQNIYRQRQFYQTLCSLFINENSTMLYLIKNIRNSKTPYETQYQSHLFKNLILSFKQEFDLRTFIIKNKIRTFSLQSTDSQFESLKNEFFIAHNQFLQKDIQNDTIKLKDTKQKFEEIIKYYGFLNRKKYEVFKINLQMYITFLDLMIQLNSRQNSVRQYNIKQELSRSQFIVQEVELEGSVAVLKEVFDDTKSYEYQQMREISILSNMPKNNLIIEYKGYQINEKKQFQIFLEYFESKNLYFFIKEKSIHRQKNLDENEKIHVKLQMLQISKQILQGIDFLHEHNIVHGDIKLANILINKNGQIKIIDFSESGFMVEETLGYTRGYDAKDISKSKYIDYYSLGVLLIKILCNYKFSIVCSCKKEEVDYENENHELHILNETSKIKEEINQYSKIFFDQIVSLLMNQPYLRCPLQELIYLIDMEISIIKNNSSEKERQICEQKYIQKYGKIVLYDQIKTESDIVSKCLFGIQDIKVDKNYFNQDINYQNCEQSSSQSQENRLLSCQQLNNNRVCEDQNNNEVEKDKSQGKEQIQQNQSFNLENNNYKEIMNRKNEIQKKLSYDNNQLQNNLIFNQTNKQEILNDEIYNQNIQKERSDLLQNAQINEEDNKKLNRLTPDKNDFFENNSSNKKQFSQHNNQEDQKISSDIQQTELDQKSQTLEGQTIKKGYKNHNNQLQQNRNNLCREHKINLEKNDSNRPIENEINNMESLLPQKESLQKIQNISDQENQVGAQNSKSKSLESYFIDRIDKKESYPFIFKHLKQLNINFRDLGLDIDAFTKLSTNKKIKYICEKLIQSKSVKLELLLSLILPEAYNLTEEQKQLNQDLRKFINQILLQDNQKIGKSQKEKVTKFFLQFKD
ncbi:hypothetical protein ABPG72_000587 [Tetrahymena utriculariae]